MADIPPAGLPPRVIAHGRETVIGDILLQRVVALAGVVLQVALPARGVVEELQHRHPLGDVLVTQPELRQIPPHRRIQVDLALFDQPQHRDRMRASLAGAPMVQHGVAAQFSSPRFVLPND